MTLDEFVLYFRDFSLKSTHVEWRTRARHLYICLALDLSSCHEAKVQLEEDLKDNPYVDHGCNVPKEFERHLEQQLKSQPLATKMTVASCRKLLKILVDTVLKFVESLNLNSANPLLAPFCCCAQNVRNQSHVDNLSLCRYVELGTFEQWYLLPGLGMPVPSIPKARKSIYSKQGIHLINSRQTTDAIEFGRPDVEIEKRSMPSPAFFTPYDEAPHHLKKGKASADVIAAEMGMAEYLSSSSGSREHDGFAVLRFEPDDKDLFFRPTILDALSHPPFRPGENDDGKGELFRFGYTRKFKPSELRTDPAQITERRGKKEVVTRVRKVLFSDQFRLEDVRFFEP